MHLYMCILLRQYIHTCVYSERLHLYVCINTSIHVYMCILQEAIHLCMRILLRQYIYTCVCTLQYIYTCVYCERQCIYKCVYCCSNTSIHVYTVAGLENRGAWPVTGEHTYKSPISYSEPPRAEMCSFCTPTSSSQKKSFLLFTLLTVSHTIVSLQVLFEAASLRRPQMTRKIF